MQTMAAKAAGAANGGDPPRYGKREMPCGQYFQMPLHYPRYTKADYEAMPEWQLDRLLSEYGLPATGSLAQKRSFAMGAFLWSSNAY